MTFITLRLKEESRLKKTSLGESLTDSHAYNPIRESRQESCRESCRDSR